ncbi:hypothetical protein BPNPMPFG_002497 [Mesorhizobium sp. AR07]|uniref:hypothetical protein n=1 Tax=Mesorhizobium sp. AR07 TaxID=2865838 RepID=UPI00215E5840|nr:hypothetical protein [Mesorhizobium sp. AR07]UVK46787.1 hypothetical protein BPNPMPFG_002497 [Mesorhizobium sp. AR07]
MKRPFLAAARQFLIWRYGTSVEWRCTYREIAQATRIAETSVKAICLKHGYRTERGQYYGRLDIMAVDSFISLNSPNHRNRY